jgi:16S rRNA A1518/A1519 N6-dimethyltransferase RsmA/KsgA/DIM1 with predicted DNA glycosylase/AP lyase activity
MTPRPQYPHVPPPNEAHQHDLSPVAAATVVAQATLSAKTPVLEVGPGLGALTADILKTGATVLAIERDPQRVEHLKKRFASALTQQQLTLLCGDAARVLPTMPASWQVIANPPFSLTSTLVRRWLLTAQPPLAMTLVLQKEAAEKLTGVELGHTRTSILSHLVGKPVIAHHLPRNAVTPPSRVDLAVWCFRRHAQIPHQELLLSVDRLLAIAFAGPRTLREALRSVATSVQLRRQAAAHGWFLDDHPRTVTPAAWIDLAQLLLTCGKLPKAASFLPLAKKPKR